MRRFIAWLYVLPPTFEDYLRIIIRSAVLGFIYCVMAAVVFDVLKSVLPFQGSGPIFLTSYSDLFFYAAWEEIVFRGMPFYICIGLLWQRLTAEQLGRALLFLAVATSLMFGLAHGSVRNIPFQGVMGFVFCLVFLKCGGIHRNYYTGLLCSSFAHMLFNVIVYAISGLQ